MFVSKKKNGSGWEGPARTDCNDFHGLMNEMKIERISKAFGRMLNTSLQFYAV